MPTISQKKKSKIQEQILHHLFSISPDSVFTSKIAQEIARDEEFTKALLQDLKSKNLLTEVNKNPKGIQYQRRQRWRLSQQAHNIYSKHQG
tara:strand:- start:2246 stop:2518 length:273 start_codon:yes stop_codon:yes gene_type:complete